MLGVDPLRPDAKIVLQGGENRLDLVGSEGAAYGKVPQRRIRQFDLDIRIAADVGKDFRQRLAGIDQLPLPPGQLAAQVGSGHDLGAFDRLAQHDILPGDDDARAFRGSGNPPTIGRRYLDASLGDADLNQTRL